ncbi:hypothetical protein CGRA01v4_09335 [Colletotrichum graminicola]|nr:hypothetical protein CGRA01v4_09335 [Colletotrichum graminicola]
MTRDQRGSNPTGTFPHRRLRITLPRPGFLSHPFRLRRLPKPTQICLRRGRLSMGNIMSNVNVRASMMPRPQSHLLDRHLRLHRLRRMTLSCAVFAVSRQL